MKMIDMKFTKADKKKLNSPMAVVDSHQEYPWGLNLNLDNAALKKLGIDDLPDAGDLCSIQAIGKVVRVSQSASEKNNGERSVEIQITNLALVSQDVEKAERSKEVLNAYEKVAKK